MSDLVSPLKQTNTSMFDLVSLFWGSPQIPKPVRFQHPDSVMPYLSHQQGTTKWVVSLSCANTWYPKNGVPQKWPRCSFWLPFEPRQKRDPPKRNKDTGPSRLWRGSERVWASSGSGKVPGVAAGDGLGTLLAAGFWWRCAGYKKASPPALHFVQKIHPMASIKPNTPQYEQQNQRASIVLCGQLPP